jgi:predicted RNA binding protein YcfA (HicA-like mRNA interferase family)
MAGWQPIKRREFIRRLKALGFEGPFRGTRHEFMHLGNHRQTVPSNTEFSVPQLRMLPRQVESICGPRLEPVPKVRTARGN